MPSLGALTWKSAERARAMFPPLGPIQRAIYVADAARVNGDALRLALVQAARHHGASVVTGNAALAIKNGRVTGVVLDGRHVSADVVVVVAGSWINELLAPLSMPVPIAPHRGQIIHLSLGQTDTSEWPMVVPLDGKYILPFDPNREVTGATQEPDAGFDPEPTASGVHLILDRLLSNAPGLANVRSGEVRVGFPPWSSDGIPFLGPVAGTSNVIVVTGFGASGLHLGPYAGLVIGRLLEGAVQNSALRAFRVHRTA